MTILNFDARQVAPATGQMDPVPNGWYILAMTKSGEKPTRNGDANYLEVEYTILDGPHKDRKVFENFNLWHPTNVQAKEIAWREMSALCHATGRIQVGDTSELHNIPFKGKIRIKPGEGDYGPKNEVMAYRAINDPQPVDHGVKGVGAPAHGAPAAFTPPPAAAPQAAWGPPAAPQQPQQPWQQPQAQQPAPQQPPAAARRSCRDACVDAASGCRPSALGRATPGRRSGCCTRSAPGEHAARVGSAACRRSAGRRTHRSALAALTLVV
jgi:hypothetical protein